MDENAQSLEPVTFGAVASASEHDAIQRWRLNNPDGFILNMKSKNKGMLHGVDCPHFGDDTWVASEREGDLSNTLKYCSTNPDFLQDWAEEQGIHVAFCSDCIEDAAEDEPSTNAASEECCPEPIASPEQFQKALLALRDKKKLTAEHLEILKNMASAPGRKITAARLAQAMKLENYSAANLRMGLFAHLLADELSYTPPTRQGGRPMWWTTLASGLGASAATLDQHFQFTMRPELIDALTNMRWIKG